MAVFKNHTPRNPCKDLGARDAGKEGRNVGIWEFHPKFKKEERVSPEHGGREEWLGETTPNVAACVLMGENRVMSDGVGQSGVPT